MGKVKESIMTLEDQFVEIWKDYGWISTNLLYQINYSGPKSDINKMIDNTLEAAKLYGKLEALACVRNELLGDDRGINLLNSLNKPLVFERAMNTFNHLSRREKTK